MIPGEDHQGDCCQNEYGHSNLVPTEFKSSG